MGVRYYPNAVLCMYMNIKQNIKICKLNTKMCYNWCVTQQTLLTKQQMFIVLCVIGQVQGLQLLEHHQQWTLPETPLRQPAVAGNHGDPVAIVPQNQMGQLLGWVNSKPWNTQAVVKIYLAALASMYEWIISMHE